jgi:hypothetical protein
VKRFNCIYTTGRMTLLSDTLLPYFDDEVFGEYLFETSRNPINKSLHTV